VYRRGPRISLLGVIYVIVGVVIANSHHYFEHIDSLRQFFSAVLAVALWPLILLGIDLHIKR
jgi:ABC-type anion transport system duplicated permease subunit